MAKTKQDAQHVDLQEGIAKFKDQKKLLSNLNDKFNECASRRMPFDRQWYLNMSFYFGRQWVEWVGANSSSANWDFYRLYEPPAPNWRVRLVINKIRPIIRNELTKLTKEELQYFVMPESTENKDIEGARAAEQISEFLFDDTKFNKRRSMATFWALLCGSSFFKSYYDPTSTDSAGNPGKICVDPIDAFHLFVPNLQEEEIENQPYVIHASAKDKDWVERTFPDTPEINTDVVVSSSSLEQRFFNALGIRTTVPNYVYVKEVWIKPTSEFPNGALITWTKERLLRVLDGWPYDLKNFEYPFSKIDHIPTGRFYGDSVIVDLIPLQKEYNRTRSQLIEAKNRMARPQLVAPKGSIDTAKITSEPGLIITYKPGFQPPQPLKLTEIPSYVIQEVERIQRDMDDNAGQYEIAHGRTPPGVEAASAIAYLQEENDTRLHHTTASIEHACEKVGKQLLQLVQQFWDQEHKIKVVGENKAFEAMVFSASDVAGNTDFRIESGSSAPRSRAAKQAFLTELGKLGWLQPDQVFKYLGMVETDRLFDEMQVSIRQARREDMMMMQTGQMLPINEYDDDLQHINQHSLNLRQLDLESLTPEVKQLLIQHLTMHRQRYGMSQMPQQPQPNQPQGPPPGPPQQPELPFPPQGA